MHECFPMQTLQDVISRMPNAKVLSLLDVNYGVWQVKLAKVSSKLQLPSTHHLAGIVTHVFQNVMVYLFQDIEGVEVVVDQILLQIFFKPASNPDDSKPRKLYADRKRNAGHCLWRLRVTLNFNSWRKLS